jgi:hypothetical protein
MKTIVNKTQAPIRVPLPRGKVLHLGPLQSGEISHKVLDHEPLQRMIEAGEIEIQGDGQGVEVSHEHAKGPHAETRGHHPPTNTPVKGDR